ncbi:MAG TPA: transcriptional repressor [candidate division WOR-3 bacterium]|uniref:Transcriptional repressor n=1 Tax=candidate division WOR-3 bacterium TaxID=2052148 RepID=A0A7V0T6E9_UNCW3|nr:transcriptional repressor [candidate division WOR-3 bacterium]
MELNSIYDDATTRDALRRSGLKATPRRLAVAAFLSGTGGRAATPEEVHARLRPQLSRLGLQTVYRVLEELAGAGLLARVERGDRRRSYAACPVGGERHHHHIVCTDCGRVASVDCGFPDTQRRRIERRTGFRVSGHSMQVAGVCPVCRSKGSRR